ncbi:Fc.00g074620.m01.CDS01 [Cosmosporella sp. VM-42]
MCCSSNGVEYSWVQWPKLAGKKASIPHRELIHNRDATIVQEFVGLHHRALKYASFESILEYASYIPLPEPADAEVYEYLIDHISTELFMQGIPPPPKVWDRFDADEGTDPVDVEFHTLPSTRRQGSSLSSQSSEEQGNEKDVEHSCFLAQPWQCAFPEQLRKYLDLYDRVKASEYYSTMANTSSSSSDGSSSAATWSNSSASNSNDIPIFRKYPISAENLLELHDCITKSTDLCQRGWETTVSIQTACRTHYKWCDARTSGGDITSLMKSGGRASTLRESISIGEEWPEQMEWGMPKPKEPMPKIYYGNIDRPQLCRQSSP